jgi:hypothetical protein
VRPSLRPALLEQAVSPPEIPPEIKAADHHLPVAWSVTTTTPEADTRPASATSPGSRAAATFRPGRALARQSRLCLCPTAACSRLSVIHPVSFAASCFHRDSRDELTVGGVRPPLASRRLARRLPLTFSSLPHDYFFSPPRRVFTLGLSPELYRLCTNLTPCFRPQCAHSHRPIGGGQYSGPGSLGPRGLALAHLGCKSSVPPTAAAAAAADGGW